MTSNRSVSDAALALLILAGLILVALVGLDATRWPKVPSATVDPPVTVQALLEQGSQNRHTLYAALRTEAPGARVVLDASGSGAVSLLYLRTFGTAGSLERARLADGWVPDREPDVRGALRDSSWMLFREPGPIDSVLIGSRDGRTVLVDLRSVPELWQRSAGFEPFTPRHVPTAYRPNAPSLARAVAVESLVLLAFMLLGGLLLPRDIAPGPTRPALAFLAGAAAQASSSYLFLAGRASMLLGAILAGAIGLYLRRSEHDPGWRRRDLPGLAFAAGVIATVVALVRATGSVIVQADAVQLIARAMALAAGDLGLADLDEKRPLAGSALQSIGHAFGIEGLQALSWVLLVASSLVIIMLPRLMKVRGRAGAAVTVVAGLLAAALVLNPMMGAAAKLVSTNTLVSALLLLLVVLWLREEPSGPRSGVAPAGIVSLLAIIPARAESVLIVGLILLATLGAAEPSLRWRWAWPAVGLGLTTWNGLHVLAAMTAGASPSFPVAALTAVGVITVVIGSLLDRCRPALRSATAWSVAALLWGFVFALALTPLGAGSTVFEGLQVNIGQGEGAWGAFAPAIAATAGVALVARLMHLDRRVTLPFWIVLMAVPSVIIAKAADGTNQTGFDDPLATLGAVLSASARVGSWGDSANRMWTHFAAVGVALLVITVVAAIDQARAVAPPATRSVPVVMAALAGLVAVGIVLHGWTPRYLGPAAPETILVVAERDEDFPGPELTGETRIEQVVEVPRVVLPFDASSVAVCVEYRFTDLGRVNWGTTRFGLDGAERSVSGSFGEMAWSGERERTVCLPAPQLSEQPMFLKAWLEADGRALPGSSAAVLVGGDGDPVARVEVRYVAPSEDSRSSIMQIVSRVIRWAMQAGPAVITLLFAASLALLLRRRPESAALPR